MSWVTTVMLQVSGVDAHNTMADLQQRLTEAGIGPLGVIDDRRGTPGEPRWGGTKGAQVSLYGAGYNFLNVTSFMDIVLATKWRDPRVVQLFMKSEERFMFTVYELDKTFSKWICVLDHRSEIDLDTGDILPNGTQNELPP